MINSKIGIIAPEKTKYALSIAISLTKNPSSNTMNCQRMKEVKVSAHFSEKVNVSKIERSFLYKHFLLHGLLKYCMKSHVTHFVAISLHEIGL